MSEHTEHTEQHVETTETTEYDPDLGAEVEEPEPETIDPDALDEPGEGDEVTHIDAGDTAENTQPTNVDDATTEEDDDAHDDDAQHSAER